MKRRKDSFFYGIPEPLMKRLELGVAMIVVGVCNGVWQQYAGHKQIWNETGDHFQDLVIIEQAQAKALSGLSNAIAPTRITKEKKYDKQ